MADILEFRTGDSCERDRSTGPGEVIPMKHVDLDVVLRMVVMLRRMDNPAYLDDFNRRTEINEPIVPGRTNRCSAI